MLRVEKGEMMTDGKEMGLEERRQKPVREQSLLMRANSSLISIEVQIRVNGVKLNQVSITLGHREADCWIRCYHSPRIATTEGGRENRLSCSPRSCETD